MFTKQNFDISVSLPLSGTRQLLWLYGHFLFNKIVSVFSKKESIMQE